MQENYTPQGILRVIMSEISLGYVSLQPSANEWDVSR
jgi:hypothetical protein